MQVSKLKKQDNLQDKMNRQYLAIQLWAFLNKLPFKTLADKDNAAMRWVSSGSASVWNGLLKG